MRYAEGDVVIVRPDLTCRKSYRMFDVDRSSSNVATTCMMHYAGQEVTISDSHGWPQYKIKEDNGASWWTDEMFEGLAPVDSSDWEFDESEWCSMTGFERKANE